MCRCLIKLACLSLLLTASCRVKEPQRVVSPPPPVPCAVLLSEANVEFAKTAAWTKGPQTYSNIVEKLREGLHRRGLTVEQITEDDLASDGHRRFGVIYVADTIALSRDSEEALRDYVRDGGVLVGINEVGRIQGADWTRPWHYEDIFGIKALDTDEFGTALSDSPTLFTNALVEETSLDHPLVVGLGPTLNFGHASTAAWATTSTTAAVLAWFPTYSKRTTTQPDQPQIVNERIVALSVNSFGTGKAVWMAANVHQRNPANWEQAGCTLDVLARIPTALSSATLPLPPRPVQTILAISQLGYAPHETKRAVFRFPRQETAPFDAGSFRILSDSGQTVMLGSMEIQGPDPRWGDFYALAEFSALTTEGSYRLAAELSGVRGSTNIESGPFRIAKALWSSTVVPSQYSFLYDYRCGDICHRNDPIRGGYHDAAGDYAVRMWSMPHVAYGIAENLLESPTQPTGAKVYPVEELKRSVQWLLAMQAPNGSVFLAVAPTNNWSPIELRPNQDPTVRKVETGNNLNYETTYVAGMAHAAAALAHVDTNLAARALLAARKTHERLARRTWINETTGEIGNYLWGCVELYRTSPDPVLLQRAREAVPLILQRQFLETNTVEENLRGDFLDRPNARSFGDRQYKKFHAIGLYLGLIELTQLLPNNDPLRSQILFAMDTYFSENILRGARLTPYGQMVTALEPAGHGRFKLQFFTHPKSWVRLHGLNCDHLAIALAALKYADITGRDDLRRMARDQAQWVVGMNPLGYCMIDYLGWNNAPVIDEKLGTGRFIGGIPNGIVGDLKDRPTWGATWDSREYWLPHNAYMLAVAPHLDAIPAVTR